MTAEQSRPAIECGCGFRVEGDVAEVNYDVYREHVDVCPNGPPERELRWHQSVFSVPVVLLVFALAVVAYAIVELLVGAR